RLLRKHDHAGVEPNHRAGFQLQARHPVHHHRDRAAPPSTGADRLFHPQPRPEAMNLDLAATLIALLTFFGISALMALSLNLEYGVAGVPNFGQVLFVSIGAYTTGVAYTRLLPLLAGQAWIDPCGDTLAAAVQ